MFLIEKKAGSGSGSVILQNGSEDPYPDKNETDPETLVNGISC